MYNCERSVFKLNKKILFFICISLIFLSTIGSASGLQNTQKWTLESKEASIMGLGTVYWTMHAAPDVINVSKSGTITKASMNVQITNLPNSTVPLQIQAVAIALTWNNPADVSFNFAFSDTSDIPPIPVGETRTITIGTYKFDFPKETDERYTFNGEIAVGVANGKPASQSDSFQIIIRNLLLPVGGEVSPINSLTLIVPLITLIVLTIGFTLSKKKLFLH